MMDVQQGKEYLVTEVYDNNCVTVIDDEGDVYTLSVDEYEPVSLDKDLEVPDNIYTLSISLQGTGTFFTKTKDITLPTGTDLIELISKLNEL